MMAVAALLVALYFILPEGQVMFMVEGENMPFVPSIVMGVIGIIMLATAGKKEEKKEIVIDEKKAALNKRIETIAWGLYFVMLGGFILIQKSLILGGVWSICVGCLLLGLNLVRYLYGLKMSGFTTFLGVVSVISGVTQLLGVHDQEAPILLIVLGAYLLIKPLIEKKQLFGKAEES